jgi:hypothetical protein
VCFQVPEVEAAQDEAAGGESNDAGIELPFTIWRVS